MAKKLSPDQSLMFIQSGPAKEASGREDVNEQFLRRLIEKRDIVLLMSPELRAHLAGELPARHRRP